MADITISSPNQIAAVSGRIPRVSLSDAIQAQIPEMFQNRQFALAQQGLAQQGEALNIQEQGIKLAQEQQAAAQKQGTIGTIISGAGTIGQAALAAKQFGLFGGKTAATTATEAGAQAAATPAIAAPSVVGPGVSAGEAAGTAGEGALFGAPGAEAAAAPAASAATTGATATGAAAAGTIETPVGTVTGGVGGALGTAAAGVGGGAAGTAVGALNRAYAPALLEKLETFPVGFFLPEGARQKLAGATVGGLTGGAIGFAAGGPVGGVIGAILGALGGAGICILHEAAYGPDSLEVAIARRFRDSMLTHAQRRAYYASYEHVAMKMHDDPAYRLTIRTHLTDRLVRYGAAQMRIPYHRLQPGDTEVAEAFLHRLALVGEGMPPFRRRNGELI